MPLRENFWPRIAALLTALALAAAPAAAVDLDDLIQAMGTDKVKTISFSAGGTYYHPGGSALADEDWPKFKIVNLTQRIDFEAEALAVDMPLEQLLNPPRGAGFQPIKGLLVRSWYLKGDTAWRNVGGKLGAARSPARSQHWLWTSPHGLLKAAEAAGSKPNLVTVDGRKWHTVAVERPGLFRAIGWFDVEEHLLRKVEAQIAHEVLNDMSAVTLYTGYKVFDGVKHPARIIVNFAGQPVYDLALNTVSPNLPVIIEVPAGLKPYEIKTTTEKVADGVYYIRGGSHHSVAIELEKDVLVFEAPLSVARGNAVLKAVWELFPKKKIRFVINSHHHFDHAGGLRAFAYQEVPILTHESNRNFYAEAYATARSIDPDPLSNTAIKARFLTMGDEHRIIDAERIVELYTLKGSPHAESNIVAYLPKEKMLIVADAYSSRKILEGPLPPEDVNPTQAHLWQFLRDRKLDVATILPIHGRKVGIEQLKWAAGIATDPPVNPPADAETAAGGSDASSPVPPSEGDQTAKDVLNSPTEKDTKQEN